MRILAVDPGFCFAGYAILEKKEQSILLHECGFLKLNPKYLLTKRTGQFYTFFKEKIVNGSITDIALETSFLGKNAQNFLKLGYLRGILYLLVDQHNLNIHEFSPREIKQSVTGFGGASKDQVARVVLQLFPTLRHQEKQDVTDALAVGLCSIWRNKSSLFSLLR